MRKFIKKIVNKYKSYRTKYDVLDFLSLLSYRPYRF